MNASGISVVIPAYNRGAFIVQTVQSALDQAYPDVEIIVIDDGSKDDTGLRLEPYLDRIRYVFQDNAGVSAARNHGIRLASYDYLVFLDSDDLLLPGKFGVQAAMLDADPELAFVHSGWVFIDQDGRRTGLSEPWREVPEHTLENWLMYKPVFMGASMVRKSWVERAGCFDTAYRQGEDLKLFLQMLLLGSKAAWQRAPTVCYRRHEASLTYDKIEMLRCGIRVVDEFFCQPGLPAHIREMKEKVAFGTLMWSAWQLNVAGIEEGVVEFLRQAAACNSALRPEQIIQIWLQAFYYHSLDDEKPLDVIYRLWPHIRAALAIDEDHWARLEPALLRWLKCFAVLKASYQKDGG
jgi:glycosyltransferase involved in cell wall biosynthesis